MSQPVRNTISQIFIQFIIALIAFSVLAGVASANTVAAMNTTEIVKQNSVHLQANYEQKLDADLFKSPFANDVANINLFKDQHIMMTNRNEARDNSTYKVNRRTQHQYSSELDMQLRESNKAWPFLSVTLKGQNVGVKVGSKYNK